MKIKLSIIIVGMLALGATNTVSAAPGDVFLELITAMESRLGNTPASLRAGKQGEGYTCKNEPAPGLSVDCYKRDFAAFGVGDNRLSHVGFKFQPGSTCGPIISRVVDTFGSAVACEDGSCYWKLPSGNLLALTQVDYCMVVVGVP